MKFFTYFLILVSFVYISVSFINIFDDTPEHIKVGDKVSNKVRSKISKEIERKFHVKEMGSGGGMRDKVEKLSLAFVCHQTVLKEDARPLLVAIFQYFLERVNEDSEIRPYLCNHPFGVENFDLSIHFRDKKGTALPNPYIGFTFCKEGNIVYYIEDPNNPNLLQKDKTLFTETYEEALAILHK